MLYGAGNPALNRVSGNRYCHPPGSKFVPGFDNFTHLVCGSYSAEYVSLPCLSSNLTVAV